MRPAADTPPASGLRPLRLISGAQGWGGAWGLAERGASLRVPEGRCSALSEEPRGLARPLAVISAA